MRRLSMVLLVAIAAAGCKKSEPSKQPAAGAPAAEAGAASARIEGKVTERIDAPPYTYLKIKGDKGEVWAAVPKTDAAVGTQVVVVDALPMNNFESKTLKRTFEIVYFGNIPGPGQAPGAAAMGGPGGGQPSPAAMAAQHAAAAAGPADVGEVKVAKAAGADARTVSEVFAQKGALKEKAVTIRGKVVKFNPGIMGKNWIHLRDGSGGQGTNDLTVTTSDAAALGDVVTVKGKVAIDRDFGAGYAYPAIVEDAKVSK
jgi:hypothetical protein